MSIERGPGTDARDAGVARIRRLTRVAVVGAAVLSGAVAWVAAASTHVRKATHAATQSARRTVTQVPAAVPAAATELLRELDAVDRACSRFRDDSELVLLNQARGKPFAASPYFFEAVRVSLRAAAATDGLVDPTIGRGLRLAGYDRTFT